MKVFPGRFPKRFLKHCGETAVFLLKLGKRLTKIHFEYKLKFSLFLSFSN